MVELPKISDKTDLDIDQAAEEYCELKKILNQTEGFPDGGTGWAPWLVNKIGDRMNYLRQIITDGYIELISDPEEVEQDETEIDKENDKENDKI